MKAREKPITPDDPDVIREELKRLELTLRRRSLTDRTPGVTEAHEQVRAELDSDAPDIEKARAAFDALDWLIPRWEQKR